MSLQELQRARDSLTGIFEGESVSAANDVTRWARTLLVAKIPATQSNGGISNARRLELNGRGFSLWRGQQIFFVLTGTVTLPIPGVQGADSPPSFELTKQHVGKFTNSVEYSGEVMINEDQHHDLAVSLQGTYASGRLELKRDDIGVGSTAAPARPLIGALLSGRWKGSSQSSTDTTLWTRLTLNFAPPPLDPEHSYSSSGGRDSSVARMEFERTVLLSLDGSGVSNWRNQEVPFVLSGTLDLRTLSLELEKTHTGQFTNTVRYSCGMHIDESTGLSISGVYAQGTLNLKPNPQSEVDASSTDIDDLSDGLDGLGVSPDLGNLWAVHQAQLMSGALQVFLMSLNNESAPSQHTPLPPTALEIGGEAGISSSNDVAIENEDETEHSAGGMVTLLKAMAEQGHLNGEWVGESVDTAGVQTEWVDASFTFALVVPGDEPAAASSLSTASQGALSFAGSGVSLWCSQRIPFDVNGSVDLTSKGTAVVTKQHTGAFTNKVEYSGHLLAVPLLDLPDFNACWTSAAANPLSEATVSGEEHRQQQLRAGEQLTDCVEALRVPLYGGERTTGHPSTLATMAEVEVALASYEFVIVGVYPQGRLRLRKSLTASTSGSRTNIRPQDNRESTNCRSADVVPTPLSNCEDTPNEAEAEEEASEQLQATQMHDYKNFLVGVLAAAGLENGSSGGKRRVALSGPQRRAVAEQRERSGVTPREHDQVLKLLGVDPQDVDPAHETRHAPASSGQDDNGQSGCVICLDAPPELACVPCGHVCLCSGCARALTLNDSFRFKCPVCRTKVQCTMRIYL